MSRATKPAYDLTDAKKRECRSSFPRKRESRSGDA
jgi:hypothetical protein